MPRHHPSLRPSPAPLARGLRIAALVTIAAAAAVTAAVPAAAGEGEWRVELEPVYMQIHGHDQHVLTIHELDAGATLDSKQAIRLGAKDDFSYRIRGEYDRGEWTWGAGFLWLRSPQGTGDLDAVASGGGDLTAFEVADRTFTSSGPGEALYYRVLEDTTIEMWNADLYLLRTMAASDTGRLRFQLGLKVGDFDNDYRAVVGVRDVAGRRLDASSNYDRMMGPLVGLVGEWRCGKSSLEGYLGQSVLVGSVELTGQTREFTGPFGEMPAYFQEETLKSFQDVAIPVSEVRIRWTYRFGWRLAALLGAEASTWWDVPVPPGVIPGVGGDEALHENTLIFFGLSGGVRYTL